VREEFQPLGWDRIPAPLTTTNHSPTNFEVVLCAWEWFHPKIAAATPCAWQLIDQLLEAVADPCRVGIAVAT
jgi:hypothetical protein